MTVFGQHIAGRSDATGTIANNSVSCSGRGLLLQDVSASRRPWGCVTTQAFLPVKSTFCIFLHSFCDLKQGCSNQTRSES